MFSPDDILYEDNHLLVVNKHCGDLVQPDPSGESALEDQIKAFLRERDAKPGAVFLGVVHRIDRPVSGAVLFAKTSKALARLNEMIRTGEIHKTYWALTERRPDPEQGRASTLHPARCGDEPVEGTRRSPRRCEGSPPELPHARGEHQLHARRGRPAYRTPPPDTGATRSRRRSDQGRSEIRSTPVESRRRHFAPFAQHRPAASRA